MQVKLNGFWLVFIAAFFGVPSFATMKDAVQTENGRLSGIPGRNPAVTVFEGIPFAAPPVGELRWAAPQPAKSWEGIRRADHFSDGCAQNFPNASFPKSEDCLYLNVWTPAKNANEDLPVMVWIHGGGLRVGSSREELYNGDELAAQGLVVVTMNYRLGIFGFLSHPELTKESPHHASGNYGLLDQLAALRWVQKNIAAFGGDPRKVTIFGQSAGGFSVFAQVASPLSSGLFRAAIAESGGARMGPGQGGMPSLSEAESSGMKFADSLGVHSLAELRAMSADRLLDAGGPAAAVVDGWFLPESPGDIFKEGKQNKVPMLFGSNSDEAQHMIRSAVSGAEFRDRAKKRYGADADKYLSVYPGNSDQAARISQQQEMADRTAVGLLELAEDISRSGQTAYLYYFAYLDNGGYNAEPPALGLKIGADHGAEIPYVFGLMNHWRAKVPENDLKMQNIVMSYWVNFAKKLDPNGAGLPEWRPFSAANGELMVLDDRSGIQPPPRSPQIEFLRTHANN